MTMQVERFVATFALACLCNCATTKPDSTDSPSSLIDLPEQQKQNEDKLTIDAGGGETGETVSGTGSQHKSSPDSVPHDPSPKTVSEFAESGENQGEDSSVLDQSDAREPKSTPSAPDRSSKPEANETTTTVETQSEASNPTAEGKHSLDSENAWQEIAMMKATHLWRMSSSKIQLRTWIPSRSIEWRGILPK